MFIAVLLFRFLLIVYLINKTMLDKLIAAVIKKNGHCSSSDIHSCSVRVHDNPLLSDCIVGHRLLSDLELGLQDHRADILAMLNDSVRTPKYAESGSRHVSASWLFNHLSELDNALADTVAKAEEKPTPTPVEVSPSAGESSPVAS